MATQQATLEHIRRAAKLLGLVAALLLLAVALVSLWNYRHYLLAPDALYREAQTASPERAALLYERLAEVLPEVDEYARLWAAQAAMPDIEALQTLQAVVAFRPQSPAAYQAHLAMARYYASIEAPGAEDEYGAALALHDTAALRRELARYLEEKGDDEGAYGEYLHLLGEQPDAFSGMRRVGPDALVVADDLNTASYCSDALEALRTIDDDAAHPLRATALSCLGRYEEAEGEYTGWVHAAPDEEGAQLGLASVLASLGRSEDALELYATVDTPDSWLAQAQLLQEEDPDLALELYLASPYPVAWWSATTILEAQGRLTETLPVYARVAEADTYLADDAAYRLMVLSQRIGDEDALAEGEELMADLDLNWLALRASGEELSLSVAPPMDPAGGEILEKVEALELIGREDLAHMELLLSARFRQAPYLKVAMAQSLLSRGYVTEAQVIAEEYLDRHPRAPLAFWQLSYPRPYIEAVQSAAEEFEVDPLLLWGLMRAESRYDEDAYGYAGERGLMQILPSTQVWVAEQLGEDISPGDAFAPENNIRMASWLLRFLLDYFEGDTELAIAAYNGGAGSVDAWQDDPLVSDGDDLLRWIGFGQTREYLERVSLYYRIYQELYGGSLGTEQAPGEPQ
ncbi:MAG TPA: transglycosylase SLT domain-containing protein [Anaerolineae bacterium]|nr:transglycosylase SLT domain-containing protein [Anaerolineae bacterium]